jgi:signal transduction histidine kinase
VFAAGALRRTVAGLGERPSPTRLRDALAWAFRDPSLELVFWLPAIDGYVDESGGGVELPALDGPKAFTRFDRHGVPVAAAIHDVALVGDTGALEAAEGVVLLALENARLEADLRARANELRVSRARLVALADEERRRIERDLHDGAQQQLVAVSIKLALLRELVEGDPALASRIVEAEEGIETTLELIRELAHGIYPQALRYDGLSQALALVASRLPLPITVHAEGLGRVASQIETAVYFCCLEALQNVAKHATIRTPVDVQLTAHNGELRFSLIDHGPGFDPRTAPQGHGITGMRDRIRAIGGELDIVSTPGQGATVAGHVPLAAA